MAARRTRYQNKLEPPGIAIDGNLVHFGDLPDQVKLDGWLGA